MINTTLLNKCIDLETKVTNGLLVNKKDAEQLLKEINIEITRLITLVDQKIVPEEFVNGDLKELSKYVFLCTYVKNLEVRNGYYNN